MFVDYIRILSVVFSIEKIDNDIFSTCIPHFEFNSHNWKCSKLRGSTLKE